MFLFLITQQYQLAAERTETTDKRKTKTSKTKRTITAPQVPGSWRFATDVLSPPVPTAADAGPGHIASRTGLSPGSQMAPSLSHQARPSHFSHLASVAQSSSQNTALHCRCLTSLLSGAGVSWSCLPSPPVFPSLLLHSDPLSFPPSSLPLHPHTWSLPRSGAWPIRMTTPIQILSVVKAQRPTPAHLAAAHQFCLSSTQVW